MASGKSELSLTVPRFSEEVTAHWFSQIINIPKPEMKDFTTFPNSFTDFGNLSNIVRVQFERDTKKFNYIVKLLPIESELQILEVFYSDKFDQKEIFFYKTLLPELLQEAPELEKYICPFVYGQIQEAFDSNLYASVLVLEDLGPLNYTMPTFEIALSKAEIDEGIDFAVVLNIAGKSLICRKLEEDSGSTLPEIYPRLKDWRLPSEYESGNIFEKFKSMSWFPIGLQFIVDQVLPWHAKYTGDEHGFFAHDYTSLIPVADKILRLIFKESQKYPSIVHDDLWPHNFLITAESISGGSKLPLKVIDWQMVGYSDPVYDLSHFLLSCLPILDLKEDKLRKLVTEYYKKYETLCSTRNLDVGRTLDEFLTHFFKYGLSYSLIWFSLSCDSIFANSVYRPKLYKLFELLYELRVPQFLRNLTWEYDE